MYELLRKGQLSATTSEIADYLPYTAVKFAELLESHTLASAIIYDNEYRKLQCEYGFRWGSDSQHLHIRFLVKRRSSVLTTNLKTRKKFPHALTANRKPPTQPRDTNSMSIPRSLLHDVQSPYRLLTPLWINRPGYGTSEMILTANPVFCHALSAQLRRVLKPNDSSLQPHFSQLAFSSFPRQVQYMLKFSYSKKNWESIVAIPLRYQPQLHTSHNYERSFASVSSSATPQFPAAPYTFSGTSCSSRDLCPPSGIPNYLNVVRLLHLQYGYPNPLDELLLLRKPSSWEV